MPFLQPAKASLMLQYLLTGFEVLWHLLGEIVVQGRLRPCTLVFYRLLLLLRSHGGSRLHRFGGSLDMRDLLIHKSLHLGDMLFL